MLAAVIESVSDEFLAFSNGFEHEFTGSVIWTGAVRSFCGRAQARGSNVRLAARLPSNPLRSTGSARRRSTSSDLAM